MNKKRKYLREKKIRVKSCEHFKGCIKSRREESLKSVFRSNYIGAVQKLIRFNEKYYEARTNWRNFNSK